MRRSKWTDEQGRLGALLELAAKKVAAKKWDRAKCMRFHVSMDGKNLEVVVSLGPRRSLQALLGLPLRGVGASALPRSVGSSAASSARSTRGLGS